jgi:hypothetical protein
VFDSRPDGNADIFIINGQGGQRDASRLNYPRTLFPFGRVTAKLFTSVPIAAALRKSGKCMLEAARPHRSHAMADLRAQNPPMGNGCITRANVA